MTSDKSLFRGVVMPTDVPVRGVDGDGGRMRATGVGRGVMFIDGVSIGLRHLYYVPGLDTTLVSISQLVECGASVLISKVDGAHTLELRRQGGGVARVLARDGMYPVGGAGGVGGDAIWVEGVLDDAAPLRGFVSVGGKYVGNTHTGSMRLSELLHHRLGHQLWGKGPLARRLGDAFGKSAAEPCGMASCESCARAKMRRSISRAPPSRPATRPLERIHFDLSPSIPVSGGDGHCGFCLLVDEYTRHVWVELIHSKAEVPEILRTFKLRAERQFRQRLGTVEFPVELMGLRSDNAAENVGRRVREWCKEHGIVHETSAPYSQWQDGIAERHIQEVWNGSEAMRLDAGAPPDLWPYSLQAFVHVRNRLALGADPLSPWELWHGVEVPLERRIAHLRRWGSKAYVLVPKELRRKLEDKARLCVFLGYSPTSKAYICMDLVTRKVYVSATVIFDETSSPLADDHVRNHMNQERFSEAAEAYHVSRWPKVGKSDPGARRESEDFEAELADDEGPCVPESGDDDIAPSGDSDGGGDVSSTGSEEESVSDQESALASDSSAEPGLLEEPSEGRPRRYDDRALRIIRREAKRVALELGAVSAPVVVASGVLPGAAGVVDDDSVAPGPGFAPGPVPEAHFAAITGLAADVWRGTVDSVCRERGAALSARGGLSALRADLVRDMAGVAGAAGATTSGAISVPVCDVSLASQRLRLAVRLRDEAVSPKVMQRLQNRIELLALAAKAPASFDEAISSVNSRAWWAAMDAEIENMGDFGAWKMVERKGRGTVGSQWVYAIKRDAMGVLTKLKARLVVQGNTMVSGRDYDKVWSPTCRIRTFRFMMAEASQNPSWQCRTWDTTGAFLHAHIDKEVLMRQPRGYHVRGKDTVCKLLRAVYGCKQSGRLWHAKIHAVIMALGEELGAECTVQRGQADTCYYTVRRGSGVVRLLVHVDDFAVTFNDEALYNEVFGAVRRDVDMNESPMDNFLGIGVVQLPEGGYGLHQEGYIEQTLERMGMSACQLQQSPEAPGSKAKLTPLTGPLDAEEAAFMRSVPYTAAVGALHYLARATRFEISHAVSQVARFMANPGPDHWRAVQRIYGYLRRTKGVPLVMRSDSGVDDLSLGMSLHGYSDSDWAGCKETRRSHTGWVVRAGTTPVAWYSKQQGSITQSTAEAELVAVNSLSNELCWWRMLMDDFGYAVRGPFKLFCDNSSAVTLSEHSGNFSGTKHIELKHLLVRQRQEAGEVAVQWCDAESQLADIFTKNCRVGLFRKIASTLMGVQL